MACRNTPDDVFTQYVAESKTWTELAKKCGYNSIHNFVTLKKRVVELGLSQDHFPRAAVKQTGGYFKKCNSVDIFIENSSYTNTKGLKNRLKEEFKWEHKCSWCNLTEWLGEPIPLELDHINGLRTDHRIENLRFLCPNCHAKTDTYKGKNRAYETRAVQKKCVDCNANIWIGSMRCSECMAKQNYFKAKTEKKRPSLETLKNDVHELNYSGTGKKYGVTDNTIRKWIKKAEKYEQTTTIKLSLNSSERFLKSIFDNEVDVKLDKDNKIGVTVFYNLYKDWCESLNENPVTQTAFGKNVVLDSRVKRVINGKRFYAIKNQQDT